MVQLKRLPQPCQAEGKGSYAACQRALYMIAVAILLGSPFTVLFVSFPAEELFNLGVDQLRDALAQVAQNLIPQGQFHGTAFHGSGCSTCLSSRFAISSHWRILLRERVFSKRQPEVRMRRFVFYPFVRVGLLHDFRI